MNQTMDGHNATTDIIHNQTSSTNFEILLNTTLPPARNSSLEWLWYTEGANQTYNTTIDTEPQRSTALLFLLYIVIEVVLTITICTGNALVIAAVIRFRELRSPTYMLTCLSMSDLLVGLSLPYHIVLFFKPELMGRFGFCMTRIWALCFPGIASVLFLLGISVDRYLTTQAISTNRIKQTAILAIGIWVYAFCLTAPPLFGWNDWEAGKECGMAIVNNKPYLYMITVHIYGVLFIIILLYLLIFKRVINQRRKIAEQTVNVQNRAMKMHALAVDTRFSKNLVLIVVLYIICVCPYMVVVLVAEQYKDNPTDTLDLLQLVAVLLLLSNSWMNPIVYAARIPLFKKAFKVFLRCKGGSTVHAANL